MTWDWREPPDRADALREQRRRGRALCGVFPAVYPRELLWALDVVPVEIWDPPLTSREAAAHLQPTICAVARLGLELVLSRHGKDLDALLFPHTCDTLQNLGSLVDRCLDPTPPCFFFYPPRASHLPSARRYYRDALQTLSTQLQTRFGPLQTARLEQALAWSREITARVRTLYARRAEGRLPAAAGTFYRVLRCGEYLHPEVFLPLLDGFLADHPAPASAARGPAVVLSGVLPNPPQLLTLLDQRGVRVGHDDLLACGRRLAAPPGDSGDPWQDLTEAFYTLPPCSTRTAPLEERAGHLTRLVADSGARGVIFNLVTFCETEWFDIPPLVAALEAQGVPSLVLDTEPNTVPSGQLGTRVEAFVEMLEAP